ncbi:MAG: four helix bundle protein [Planctomycetes bacterium]|nr:four helix bundle protein [Planctomycetota bacterium]
MQSFRKLSVWRKAHELTLAVYRVTKDFPGDERYGLTSQVRRAAASIGANIAEGCGRDGGPDFARFLQLAMGSASEVEYHLLLAHDLDLLPDETYDKLSTETIEVKRMLASLIKKVRNANRNSRTDN